MEPIRPTAELPLEQRIALSYAPKRARARFVAVFALDRRLSQALARGRAPLAAQLRLAWWRDLLTRPEQQAPDPAIAAIRAAWDDDPAAAVAMVDGWEELVAEEPDLAASARGRAAPFVALAGALGGAARDLRATRIAAERWALADLADHVSDPGLRARARALAERSEPGEPLPAAMRPLTVLDGLARRALARGGPMLGDRLSPLVAIRLGILGR